MKKFLTITFLLLALSTGFCAEVLAIELKIDNADSVELVDLRVTQGTTTESVSGGAYTLSVLDNTGSSLHSVSFDVSFTAYGDQSPLMPNSSVEDIGGVSLNDTNIVIRVPYYTNAASFNLVKGTTILFQQTISLCNNNGVCEPGSGENYITCASDCSSGGSDEYCDEVFDNVCDPDCELQGRSDKDTDCTCGNGVCDAREDSITCPLDCGQPSNMITNIIYTIIGIIMGIIIVIIVIIVLIVKALKKGKKKKKK